MGLDTNNASPLQDQKAAKITEKISICAHYLYEWGTKVPNPTCAGIRERES